MQAFRISSWLFLAICASVLASALGHPTRRQSGLPVVDLGYEIHEGSVNKTGNYYIFSNIPYAKQPVADLRFQTPSRIYKKGSEINNGTTEVGDVVMCPQAYPQWVINLLALQGGVDQDKMADLLNNAPGQTEACLVLDVYVPAKIFSQGAAAKAPVLVWIHGGGFTFGSKNYYGNPAGLIARSQRGGKDGMIVVSINYRLGMFGWLGIDAPPNIGLHDQRLALEWVREHISLFGGDPEKVTAMGQSAGASSIVHHITARGGRKAAPFRAAIPLSAAFQFNIDFLAGYDDTLAEATRQVGTTVGSVNELRELSAERLASINQGTITKAPIGTFGFGPVVDGTYVTKLPQILLYEGKFASNVTILTGHTTNESVPFLPANILTSEDVEAYVKDSIPAASRGIITELLNDPLLYPDYFDGSHPWRTEFERAARLISDIGFACMSQFLSTATEARDNQAYDYVFTYPPAWHANDVPYVFFNGDISSLDNGLPVDPKLATGLQDYIVAFVRDGDPNAVADGHAARFPAYGKENLVLELGLDGFKEGVDDLRGERCKFLQQAMVDGDLR
ncbi:hypothetical protein M426DRAFT_180483 [Hypoxylon sp. CI-4A]|nr:hypothetical protein M426DRAFT_180483 [Hypoxylon sp. CI-4A]